MIERGDDMDLRVEIRRNSDGVIATDVWKEWTWNDFAWAFPHYECDCNKELFFIRAQQEDGPDYGQCSKGRYSLRLTDNDDGEVLYDEITGK